MLNANGRGVSLGINKTGPEVQLVTKKADREQLY